MCPNIFYSQGYAYWCNEIVSDLDYDSDSCWNHPEISKCRQCVHFQKQDYTIVVQDERFKKFI